MSETVSKYFYTYDQFVEHVREIGKQIDPSQYDIILALGRGGFAFGQYLAYNIGHRHLVGLTTRGYEHESDTGKRYIEDAIYFHSILKDKRVLLVDDICDSGTTIDAVFDTFEDTWKSCDVAVLINSGKDDRVKYFGMKYPGVWIVFPWDIIAKEE